MPVGNPAQPVRRARLACLECRRRKVRCSIEIYGQPCSNCILDGCICMTRNRTKRPAPMSSLAATEGQVVGAASQPQTRSLSTPSISYMGSGECANYEVPQVEIPSLPTLSEMEDREFASSTALIYQPSSAASTENPWKTALLPFSYYPYIRLPDLRRLQPDEMTFLEAQKSTHIPRQPLLNLLLKHYFLYAHQSLPLFDEGEFWSAVNSKNEERSKISLLVLQSILFVACSYISSGEAKNWGNSSVLAMRNLFYGRAKILCDFGVEEDPLCRAQACALLSYESSASDIFSNSTWLALAIQHARSINVHLYDQIPEAHLQKKCVFKRLWWSLILRDRIIALGMRRPLQILAGHFDVSLPGQIETDDFADTENTDNVYSPEVKASLCMILLAQCRLAIALSPVIMMIYPPSPTNSPGKDVRSSLARAENLKCHLQYWRSRHDFIFSFKGESHPSVAVFKQLTALYYESGRLSLHHHIAFWLHQTCRLESSYRLLDPITSINGILKRFVVDGTANCLPISVVAFTILPQILMSFNNRLSHDGIGYQHKQFNLKLFEELNKLHRVRYDTSHVIAWINQSLDFFDSSLPIVQMRTNRGSEKRQITQIRNIVWLLENHPTFYFRLLDRMECAISRGSFSLKNSIHSQVSLGYELSRQPRLRLLPSLENSRTSQSNTEKDNSDNKGFTDIEETAAVNVKESSNEDCLSLDLLQLQEQEQFTPGMANATQNLDFLSSPLYNSEAPRSEVSGSSFSAEILDPSCLALLPNIHNSDDEQQIEDFSMDTLWDGIAKFGE